MVSIKPSKIVETLSGKVQGKTYQFEDSTSSAFLGIPFAEPPVGELRFKKPVPIKKWSEVRKCTEFGSSCYYRNPTHQIKANEDCLFLNVFAPESKSPDEKPLNTLFYIHGGGFMLDSSTVLGDENICKYMCSKGIIVVTFNYRLGFFGLLTLDQNETPGNYLLWDMTLALKWVHDNIASFGGDPNHITVCGQSAGAVAVDYLSLSPHSRDLFQQGITMAGTSHCDFVCMDRKYSREFAFEYAKYLGFVDNPEHSEDQRNAALLTFFKSAKAKDLALGIMPAPRFQFRSKAMIALSPVIDGDFFPKSLDELRQEAPTKKFINGTTEFEGLLFSVGSLESNHHPLVQSMATFFMRTLLTPTSFMGRHLFKRILAKRGRKNNNKPAHETYKPLVTKLFLQTRPDLTEEKAGEILDQFVDPKLEDEEYIKTAVHLISDIMFVYGAYKMSLERTKRGDKVYTYCFKYYKPGSIGLMTLLLPFEGATHCMELPYFFGKSILGEFVPDEKDHTMLDKFSTYLIQFIKTGDPNNQKYSEVWEPFNPENHDKYFVFDEGELGMCEGYANGRLPVWDKIFEENPKQFGC